MSQSKSRIQEITPIKESMTIDEARDATKRLLQDILRPENRLEVDDVEIDQEKKCGPIKIYRLVTFKDGNSYVQAQDGIQRLIGAQYLNDQLKALRPCLKHHWETAETKYLMKPTAFHKIKCTIKKSTDNPLKNIFTIQSDDIISLSKYVGDKKPADGDDWLSVIGLDKLWIRRCAGFADFELNANLREQLDGSIIIIDTEYASFTNYGTTPPSVDAALALGGVEFEFSFSELEIA